MRCLFCIALAGCAIVHGESPLIDAARHRDHAALASLLVPGTKVDAASADGMTALHWAAEQDDLQAAQRLIEAGANPNATNQYGIGPLSLACQNGNTAMVKLLLAAGANPNASLAGGETMLLIAARTGTPGAVEALLAAGADVNAKESHGQTAMMWAAAEGHAGIVDLLLKEGADFRATLDGGFSALLFAVREGRSEAVKRLLADGADVNEAIRPQRRASRGPQPGMTPLLLAVENGHFELAIDLLKAGADPNDQRGGYTALHNVAWVRKPNHGEDEDGMPPPAGSGRLDSLQFVREIVALGADLNARIAKAPGGLGALNRTGATPFLLAAQTADIALLKLLCELGADPTLTTRDEVTPLMAAAGLGTLAAGEVAGTEEEVLEVLDWLVTIGADVNAVDRNGETAMHAAAYKNLPRVVEFLVGHGAKIELWNTKDKYGWTPLLIAEGFRPGNFKPSFETIAAIHKAMLASGVTPPASTSAEGVNNSDFGPRERKYIAK